MMSLSVDSLVKNERDPAASVRAPSLAELVAPVQDGLRAVESLLREVSEDQHAVLRLATERLFGAGGKRVRPAVTLLTAGVLKTAVHLAVPLAAAVEMLHTATLVHDDLLDGAELRRGARTLNADWSPSVTVLTGDYLFARAATLVARTNQVQIMNLFAETLMVILNGEIAQKFAKWRVDRENYYDRIYAKTAAMFVLATEAAASLGGADRDETDALVEYGRAIGMAFQVVDDCLDFVGHPVRLGKPVGEDLRQGIVTLPAILYWEAFPKDADMNRLLEGEGADQATVSRVVTAVRRSGAVDRALDEARELVARGQTSLIGFADSAYLEALAGLGRYFVERDL